MEYTAFALRIGSLHFPYLKEDQATWTECSDESMRKLKTLYQTLNGKIQSATDVIKMEKKLDGSLFCCCLPEGLALLRCSASNIQREARLEGFLVMKESLRTAWRLSRWKLLFACAAGWKHTGMNLISLDEIDKSAMSLRASKELQKNLIEMSQKMLASDVPFSFAITDFPHHALPLQFSETINVGADLSESASQIVIPEPLVQQLKTKSCAEIKIYKTMCLRHDSKKHYIADRVDHATEFEDQKQLKQELKAKMDEYDSDEIWYFTAIMNENELYIRPLDSIASDLLSAGHVDFSTLCRASERFIQGYEKDKQALNQKRSKAQEQEAEKNASSEESEKKGFGSLLKKIIPWKNDNS